MNVILSIFMVETELLIGFNKPMKKIAVSFYKRIIILAYNNFELSPWEEITRFCNIFLGENITSFRITFKLKNLIQEC